MPDAIVTALIAASAGGLGAVLTYVASNRKVRVESISAEASADLARSQASGEVITFLREDYRRVRNLYEQTLAEMASLRSEVNAYRDQLAQFEAIVLTLPDEYRSRFAEVLAKKPRRAPSPKATGGGS